MLQGNGMDWRSTASPSVTKNGYRIYSEVMWSSYETSRYQVRFDLINYHLISVQIEEYMGNLVGYGQHNRLRWAAYSPSAGEIHYGPPNNAPKEENLADGFGAPFSPFYVADEIDIQHCISISDWWRKLLAKDLSESVVPIAKGPIKRLHRLISETGPNVYPSGFFDCTVEVIFSYCTFSPLSLVYLCFSPFR